MPRSTAIAPAHVRRAQRGARGRPDGTRLLRRSRHGDEKSARTSPVARARRPTALT